MIGISTLSRNVQLPRLVTGKETIGLVFQKLNYPNLWQLIAIFLLLFVLSLPNKRHTTIGKSG